MMGVMYHQYIFVPAHQKIAYIRQDGSREWISVVEAVSAAGIILPTFAIVKGVYHQKTWFDALTEPQAVIATSPKGWTSTDLGHAWLKDHFEPLTKTGRLRLLILDGHESHCSIPFIQTAVKNDIQLLCLPPHTTHLLQPLDIDLFGPLGRSYNTQIQ